jgi:hypothetical protein
MDWSSQAFKGFGTIMRSRFGTPRETFVTLKAGDLRGHYHNEELAYHFYGAGAPISLDYNCSYHPRGDHAALHNSITFGKEEPYTHSGTAKPVEAMEQLTATAQVKAFATTPAADMVIAERSGNALVLTPTYPDDAIFGYGYPRRDVKPITHRRTLVLVKHPEGSALEDYLVVRDDTTGEEPTQLNIHLLSREITRDGNLIRATGQWGADATVYLAKLDEAAYRVGRWFYYDENAKGPNGEPKDEWRKTIHDTDGKALTPPADWTKSWTPGEYQQWLKIGLKPGTSATWVLYPRKRGTPEPTFATLPNGAVRVTLAQETDEIALDGTQAVVRVNGKETVVR